MNWRDYVRTHLPPLGVPPEREIVPTVPDDEKRSIGVSPGLIRLSVGLEDAGDLIADMGQALEAV